LRTTGLGMGELLAKIVKPQLWCGEG
jgi:hypothetical protein